MLSEAVFAAQLETLLESVRLYVDASPAGEDDTALTVSKVRLHLFS